MHDRTSVCTSRFPISSLVDRILTYSEIIRRPDALSFVTCAPMFQQWHPSALLRSALCPVQANGM
jgi:hypothetical protein